MTHVFIIAEAGVNHNGCLERAKRMIDCAFDSGADAVKFQSFEAAKLVTKDAAQAEYQEKNTRNNQSQYDLLKSLEFSKNQFKELKHYADEKGILFLSTPFDGDYLDFLVDELHMNYIKIPSGEVTNAPFLLKIAKKRKNVILSTGMCTLDDIQKALSVLALGYSNDDKMPTDFSSMSEKQWALLCQHVSILHCTTDYPTPYHDVNLNVLHTFSKTFQGMNVGYSDHTLDIFVPIAAVAMGAHIIEKHFTLDRALEGPDHKASLQPEELKKMCEGIRAVEKSLGSFEKTPTPTELKNRNVARKSLVANTSIQKGDLFSQDNLTCKRPGSGLSPMHYWDFIGRSACRDYRADDVIQEDL